MAGKKSGLEKRCSTCGETKSVKQFSKHRGSQDGYQTQCKTCAKKYKQSEKGKEVRKEYDQSKEGREVQKKHNQSEKRRKSRKKYEQSEKGRQAKKKYKQSEKGQDTRKKYGRSEKGRQSQKKHNQSEKGRQSRKKADATRSTHETQAGGSYTTDQWFNLCKFYNFRCLKCNKKFPFEKLTLDHVKPVSKGGSSDIWNTQPLCGKCNSSKGDKEIDYRQTLPDWINRDGPIWIQDTLF